MCQCVEHHWNNSRLHTNALCSPPPPQGRSCSQSGQDRGQSIFQNLHSVHQQCCSMKGKKVVLTYWLEVADLRPPRYLPRCRPRRPAGRRKIGSQISLRQPWSAWKSRQEGLGVVARVALQTPFFNRPFNCLILNKGWGDGRRTSAIKTLTSVRLSSHCSWYCCSDCCQNYLVRHYKYKSSQYTRVTSAKSYDTVLANTASSEPKTSKFLSGHRVVKKVLNT